MLKTTWWVNAVQELKVALITESAEEGKKSINTQCHIKLYFNLNYILYICFMLAGTNRGQLKQVYVIFFWKLTEIFGQRLKSQTKVNTMMQTNVRTVILIVSYIAFICPP